MTHTHGRTAKTTVYGCRYPGCEFSTTAPTSRGRHESMMHGMSKGLLNGKAPNLNPTPPQLNGEETWTPVALVRQALAEVEQRQDEVLLQLTGLAALEQEAEKLGEQKKILSETLDRLQPSSANA